jgi:hypothetical protein
MMLTADTRVSRLVEKHDDDTRCGAACPLNLVDPLRRRKSLANPGSSSSSYSCEQFKRSIIPIVAMFRPTIASVRWEPGTAIALFRREIEYGMRIIVD